MKYNACQEIFGKNITAIEMKKNGLSYQL